MTMAQCDGQDWFENGILKSVLDSGKDYDHRVVHQCINFARYCAEFHKIPNGWVMTRLLELSILSNDFVGQLAVLDETFSNHNWIYQGLAKLISNGNEMLMDSLRRNCAIWTLLCDRLLEDVWSKPIPYTQHYHERDETCCFLVESLVLYWPLKMGRLQGSVTIEGLALDFCDVCAGINSETAFRVLSALAVVFPHVIAKGKPEVIRFLEPKCVALLYRLGHLGFAMGIGDCLLGSKLMICDQAMALRLVTNDRNGSPNKPDILEMINRFNPTQQFF
jgi:hypothetical protein